MNKLTEYAEAQLEHHGGDHPYPSQIEHAIAAALIAIAQEVEKLKNEVGRLNEQIEANTQQENLHNLWRQS